MGEKTRIHRICPCHSYDIEGIQTWLEDMAAGGCLLEQEGCGLGFFSFERTAPRRCRFRLEVKDDQKRRGEFLAAAADWGWELTGQFGGFDIFRADDPLARELNTDPEVQALTLKKLKKERTGRFVYLLAYFLFLFFIRRWSWVYPVRCAVTFGPLAAVLMVLCFAWCLAKPLADAIRLYRLEKALSRGVMPVQRSEWRRFARAKVGFKLLPAAALLWGACLWLGVLANAADSRGMETLSQDPPFVTLSDLAGDSQFSRTEAPLGSYNNYVFWDNALSPVNYEWREHGRFTAPDGSSNSGLLILDYHETGSEWIAKGLAEDYYHYDCHRYGNFEDLGTADLGLDSVRIYRNYSTYILIRHDSIVIHAVVDLFDGSSAESCLRWAEAMAQLLLADS